MILEYAAEAISFDCEDSGFAETVLSLLRPSFGESEPAGQELTGSIEVRLGDAAPTLDVERPWRRPPRLVMNDTNGPSFYIIEYGSARVTLLRTAEEDAAAVVLVVDRDQRKWTVTASDTGDDSARAVARLVKYFFGCLVAARGGAVLHAAAVEKSGAAILFAGPKGSGKSTLMMRLCVDLGARFISDDLVVCWTSRDGALRCSGWPKRVAIPTSAFSGREVPADLGRMRSRRPGALPLEGLGEPAEHRPPERRQRVQMDADEFLRCFGIGAARNPAPVAIVRPRFSVDHEEWSLARGGAGIYDGVIEPKHQWLFTDYLSLVPEPRGPRLAMEHRDLLLRLPAYSLQYRDLSRDDLETIWTSVREGSTASRPRASAEEADRLFVPVRA